MAWRGGGAAHESRETAEGVGCLSLVPGLVLQLLWFTCLPSSNPGRKPIALNLIAEDSADLGRLKQLSRSTFVPTKTKSSGPSKSKPFFFFLVHVQLFDSSSCAFLHLNSASISTAVAETMRAHREACLLLWQTMLHYLGRAHLETMIHYRLPICVLPLEESFPPLGKKKRTRKKRIADDNPFLGRGEANITPDRAITDPFADLGGTASRES